MLFSTPDLDRRQMEVLDQIDGLQRELRHQMHQPRRWVGSLRRLTLARALQGSNTIEGFDASLDDVAAIALDEEPLDAAEETRRALEGYRNAMTYVVQLSDEADFEYSTRLFKSLHFMMTNYDLTARPGLWRAGAVFVQDDRSGNVVYEGADIRLVADLMEMLASGLNENPTSSAVVDAAMAHLNLVMVHPFRDGNGRMARVLQSLVLARRGVPLSPVFLSIEEYLGRNTAAYYDVLAEVGGGYWQPHRSARPWVRFVLTAHLRQARTLVRRIEEAQLIWERLEEITANRGLPERTLGALYDALSGLRVRNATYRAALSGTEDEITESTASKDFRVLVEAGLLRSRGEKRGRHYVAGSSLQAIREEIVAERSQRDDGDPFGADV